MVVLAIVPQCQITLSHQSQQLEERNLASVQRQIDVISVHGPFGPSCGSHVGTEHKWSAGQRGQL